MAYYYIDVKNESAILPFVNAWNADSKKTQTIITGIYINVNYLVVEEDSTISAKQRSGNFVVVKRKQQINLLGEIINQVLIGFTVEGILDQQLPPNVYAQLMGLEGVHCEAKAENYIAYIEELKSNSIRMILE